MDIESQPIQIFVKEALMRTPQGLVVIASFITYWALSVGAIFIPEYLLPDASYKTIALILFIPWPFVSLLANLMISSPHHRSSLFAAALVGFSSVLPLWWVYA